MKTKFKQIIIPALFMVIAIAVTKQISQYWDFGVFAPHVGILFIAGLLFGPYGALGATLTNIIIDLYSNYTPLEILPSAIISFGISLLAYKIWYIGLSSRSKKITKPQLDNTYNLSLFLVDLLICALLYSVAHGNLYNIIHQIQIPIIAQSYFLVFINGGFISGIISLWLFRGDDFVASPKKSKKTVEKKIYILLSILLLIMTGILLVSLFTRMNNYILMEEVILFTIFLYAYLTRPLPYDITERKSTSLIEKIMNIFLAITMIIAIFGIILSLLGSTTTIINIKYLEHFIPTAPLLAITDIIITLFFIPGIYILKYLEKKIIKIVLREKL